MTYVLSRFNFTDMMDCRGRLRTLFDERPGTLAGAAASAVDFFYEQFVDDDGEPACALVRFFKTHLYDDLPANLQGVVQESFPSAPAVPDLRCLTLLATRGQEEAWNYPHLSRGHQVIPLPSEEMVLQTPMIAQLITQMGVPITAVIRPSRNLLLDRSEARYNVFYVAKAADSPYIVAQEEFVVPYGIESVVGFGGMLASGDLFALIMFSKVAVPPDAADQFRVIGLNLKVAILPYSRYTLFGDS